MPVNNYDVDGESLWSAIVDAWETICYEVKTFVSCIEIEAGLGGGVGGGINIYGVEVTAYAGVDIARITMDNNSLAVDQAIVVDAEVTAVDFYGAEFSYRKPRDPGQRYVEKPAEVSTFVGVKNPTKSGKGSKEGGITGDDFVISFGASLAIGIGGHISVGFNFTEYYNRRFSNK